MKRGFFWMAFGCIMLLTACGFGTEKKAAETAATDGAAAEESFVSETVTFVWEEPGAGSDCVLTLEPDGTFQLYEGVLSSLLYGGTYEVDGDVVTLKDTVSSEETKTFRFRTNDDRTELAFLADGSDELAYCKLEDGTLFRTGIQHDRSEYRKKQSD